MKISFIIIEFFSIDEIEVCCRLIDDIMKLNTLEYELIISSNSLYSLKQQIQLKRRYEWKWLFNEKNGGFAYAMNQGLKAATGNILVIMNPDVKIKVGIENMIRYLLQHGEVGIIAPQIRNSAGVIQDSFRDFIIPFRFVKRHLDRLCKKKLCNVPEYCIAVDWVIGAFMMMTRQTYEAVGGLDDGYFLYCEDMDLCKRMHLKGYSVVYYPEAVIEYEGTRSARHSWKYARIFLRSLFRYWRKFGVY